MQNRTKAEKIKTAVWLVLGLAMLVYYIISGIFAGFRISMLGIWALGGVVCLVAAALTARLPEMREELKNLQKQVAQLAELIQKAEAAER